MHTIFIIQTVYLTCETQRVLKIKYFTISPDCLHSSWWEHCSSMVMVFWVAILWNLVGSYHRSSETLTSTSKITRHHILGDHSRHHHKNSNLKTLLHVLPFPCSMHINILFLCRHVTCSYKYDSEFIAFYINEIIIEKVNIETFCVVFSPEGSPSRSIVCIFCGILWCFSDQKIM